MEKHMDSLAEILVIVGVVIVVAFVFYEISNRGVGNITEAESQEQLKTGREKFAALGDSIKTMTIAQISAATGLTERGLRATIVRHGLVCADCDGVEILKCLELDEGKSASQLNIEQMEKQTIGTLSPKVKCPHCTTIGQVYKNTNATQTETTQSARLTAILLEGQKITSKKVTQFHCKNCETTWNI